MHACIEAFMSRVICGFCLIDTDDIGAPVSDPVL